MRKVLVVVVFAFSMAATLPAEIVGNHYHAVPEVDPGSAANALVLIGGGLLMLRGRRRA